MKSIKSKVLVSLLAFALAVTSIATPSVSAEAASSKKAVKSVTLKVNKKKVNSKTTTLQVGKTLTVKTTVSPSSAKKSISYKTSNKKIATVSSKGKVKAVKAGTAKITVTVKGKNNKKKTAWFKVKVTKKATPTKAPTKAPTATAAPQEVAVTGITLTASATTIATGQTAQVYAEIQPTNATNKSLTYTSSDTSVATITNAGIVTALKDGETTITAKAANGVTGTLNITVKTVDPTSMSLNVSTLDLTVGGTSVLSTVFVPENTTEKNVTWSSDKESVAKVDSNGTVTAIGEGTAVITATSENGLTATCIITVKAKTNDNTNGVTISVANSLKDYENTVFTGNNADVKVRVYKDGKPVGNTDVTLKMEHKSANDYWYISNNQSATSTVKTDSQGIASFTISLMPGYDYNATDGVMGGYLLTATATGASTTAQAPLTFARFTVGSARGKVATTNYSFSNVTVDNLLTNLVQGENANEKGIFETKTIERKIINVKEDENKLIGTSEYVVSQKVSDTGSTNHAVTFDAAPLIQYPEVITGTDDNDYKQAVNFECSGYTVYDTSNFTYIAEVPTNLNYATLNFASAVISDNTALKIEVYKDYDEDTNEPVGSAIKTYSIKGEHVEENFGFQIPIQELAKLSGVEDYICIKVYVQSEGQIDVDKSIGFNLVNITGNYVGTSKYKNVSEIYADASIEWKQVQVGEVGSDPYLYANYQSKVTMTADEAQAYGIPVKNPGDTYYRATVEYKVPTYPHIGNAYVIVTKPNSAQDVTYFMIPTEAVNNENKLISSDEVQAFRITTEEAMDYVGTVTATDSTVTVNSEKSGITEIYGFLTVPELDYLTLEERRLFAYVDWVSNPEEEIRDITDFYALVGQTITVDVLVTDNNGNPQSDKEVEFYLAEDKEDEEKLTKANLSLEGVTITNDSTKFDEMRSTVKTDKDGVAHITFKSDSYLNGIIERELSAECKGYNVSMSVDGTTAEYVRLYWIAPGLSFTDQTQITSEETKDGIAQQGTKKISYELASADVGQTETQEKKIDSTWLIGYQVVGLVEGSAYVNEKAAAAAGFSNVIISGIGADITLNGSGANDVLGTALETDKQNATIKITSEKTGLDLIKGSVSKDSIEENAIVYFTILDDFGNVKYTSKNVGKGATSAQVGLNIPIKWAPVDMDYEIVTPSGDTFAVDEKLAGKNETVYVKVSDSKGNLLDDYEVTYSIKCTENGVTTDIIQEAKVNSKNGLVPVTYTIPDRKCSYEITATVEGNETKTKTINYVEKAESTVDFGMRTAVIDEGTSTITVTLSDRVNITTLDKDMFTVTDDTDKTYTVRGVAAADGNDRQLVITLGNTINSAAKYVNVTYNEVTENIDKQRMARRLVSNSQSGITMEDGFTVTAYTSAIPEIEYADGVVRATKGTLPEGAYVIFTYNTTVVKCVVVKADGTATDTTAATANDVVAYTGTSASNAAIYAPVEEEVVEEVVETTEEDAVAEAIEE